MNYIVDSAKVIGDVTLGDNVSVWYGAVIRGDEGKITIGDNTNVQDNCVLHADGSLEIGSNVTIGHGAVVHCSKIGNWSLIGMNATILQGAVIGKNCIIGAGSLITPNKQIPDNSVVMGVPGKVVREITDEEKEKIKWGVNIYLDLMKKALEE